MHTRGQASSQERLTRFLVGGVLQHRGSQVNVRALEGISLHLQAGDRLGLIGMNGAGKSTLLRIMAQVQEPTGGLVHSRGVVGTLFDLTLGMDMDSTGYENIRLGAKFLGLTRKALRESFDEIAEFTELGEFLAMPMRTYSAGMKLRLAFAIATGIRPDILLVDEVIGAGDATFVQKAHDRMDALVRNSGILVIASHAPWVIKKFCNRLMWLEKGRIVDQGEVDSILRAYADRYNLDPKFLRQDKDEQPAARRPAVVEGGRGSLSDNQP